MLIFIPGSYKDHNMSNIAVDNYALRSVPDC